MGPVVVRLRAPVRPAQAGALCARLHQELRDHAGRGVLCHLDGAPDLTVVAVLARMSLMSRRLGAPLRVRTCGDDLPELLALLGLDGVLRDCLEPAGQAEAGEQGRVEEVVDVHELPL